MGTSYKVYEDSYFEVSLDESSCKFQLAVHVKRGDEHTSGGCVAESPSLTEDQVIELAAKILGPLYYFEPDGNFIKRLDRKLEERGYK